VIKQRAKDERLAQAKRFFAYGFGPVAGKKVIVEEVGAVSDDEEDYGDYQMMRTDVEDAKSYLAPPQRTSIVMSRCSRSAGLPWIDRCMST
jgi:hypothetical protein